MNPGSPVSSPVTISTNCSSAASLVPTSCSCGQDSMAPRVKWQHSATTCKHKGSWVNCLMLFLLQWLPLVFRCLLSGSLLTLQFHSKEDVQGGHIPRCFSHIMFPECMKYLGPFYTQYLTVWSSPQPWKEIQDHSPTSWISKHKPKEDK